jgi:hypothetical protein
MYKGQALASDILGFAQRHGFHFAGFTYLQEISSHRLPIGARAKGFVGFGDALFLRSIDSVRAMGKPAREVYLALMKLAFIALNFGYLEYAMEAADAAEAIEPSPSERERLMQRDCYRMLFALQAAVRGLPHRLPYIERIEMTTARKTILKAQEEKHGANPSTAATLEARVEAWRKEQLEGLRLRNLIRNDPIAAGIKLLRYSASMALKMPYTDLKVAEIRASVPPELRSAVHEAKGGQPSSPTTLVEQILEEYGYVWWGDVVRRRRKSAEPCAAGEMY